MTHAGIPEHSFQQRLNVANAVGELVRRHFGVPHRNERFVCIADVEVFSQSHPHIHVGPGLKSLVESSHLVDRSAPHHDRAANRRIEAPALEEDSFEERRSGRT